jgi:prevent-host-death family protein
MPITTLSSRELNQDLGGAKRAAKRGPVFITDRGRPSHVLLSIEEYKHITQKRRNLGEALAMPETLDIEFDPSRVNMLVRPVDLT